MSNQEEVIQTDQGVACVYYSGTYKRYVCDIMKPKVERKTFLKREKAVEFAKSKVDLPMPPAPKRTSSSSRWDILRRAGGPSRSSSSSSASSKSLSNSS